MVLKVHDYTPVPDYKIINAIRNNATPDFQRRIPHATQATVQDSIQALLSNTPARNEFVSALMNRIGRIIGRHMSWDNPMGKFKIGMLEDGDTIEEVMVGLIDASVYDVNRDYMEKDLFGQDRPYVQTSFHKENRRNQYKFTLNERELRKAFTPGDEYGLTSFVQQVMASANKSDSYDEYLLMMSLFRQNFDNGGFFKVQVPDVGAATSDREDGNKMLRLVREFSHTLKFISERFNAARMPVAAKPEDLELFLPSAVDAALDVESLAGAFNIDRADVHTRKNVMPYHDFNIPGLQGILTTRDFFVVADTHYEVTELQNPAGRYRNYWLQHDQIVSLSRFAPTILFTTEPGDPIEIRESDPVSVSEVRVMGDVDGELTDVDEVTRGETYRVEADVTVDPEDGLNTAVKFGLMGNESALTRLDAGLGSLYVGEDETADELTITAIAVGDNTVASTTVQVVGGDRLNLWPNPGVEADEGDDEGDTED